MNFHDHLRSSNLSPRTIIIYDQWIRRLERWCYQGRILPDRITRAQLADWADTLPATWATRKSARQALRHWVSWLGREDPLHEAIYVPPKVRYSCRALTVEDAHTLQETAVVYGGREGLVVLLGMYLAARRAEIAAMRWDGYAEGRMRFVRVKSGETADLPVHPVLAVALDAMQPRATSDYLFPGDRGRPHVSPTTVWEWVRHVGQLAEVEVTTHRLRHTALATMNDATGDLRATQEVAGHRDPATTALYTRATKARVSAAVESLGY